MRRWAELVLRLFVLASTLSGCAAPGSPEDGAQLVVRRHDRFFGDTGSSLLVLGATNGSAVDRLWGRAVAPDGNGVPSRTIGITVRSPGAVEATTQATTDEYGHAAIPWRPGPNTGAGTIVVTLGGERRTIRTLSFTCPPPDTIPWRTLPTTRVIAPEHCHEDVADWWYGTFRSRIPHRDIAVATDRPLTYRIAADAEGAALRVQLAGSLTSFVAAPPGVQTARLYGDSVFTRTATVRLDTAWAADAACSLFVLVPGGTLMLPIGTTCVANPSGGQVSVTVATGDRVRAIVSGATGTVATCSELYNRGRNVDARTVSVVGDTISCTPALAPSVLRFRLRDTVNRAAVARFEMVRP